MEVQIKHFNKGSSGRILPADLERMKRNLKTKRPMDLRKLLAERNLDTKGLKEDLVNRLAPRMAKKTEVNIPIEPYVTIYLSDGDILEDIKTKVGNLIGIESQYIKLYWPGAPTYNNTLPVFGLGNIQDNKLLNKVGNELFFHIDYDKIAFDQAERRLAFSKIKLSDQKSVQKPSTLSELPYDLTDEISKYLKGGKKKRKKKRKTKSRRNSKSRTKSRRKSKSRRRKTKKK